MDHNDWRVTISLTDAAHGARAKRSFSDRAVEEDVHRRLGRRIVVGGDDEQIFLYAGTEIAAREAERVAREVLAAHGIEADFAIDRWHPVEEAWESPDVAMPRTEDEIDSEHQVLLEGETAESVAAGVPQWEARVEFPSHREAAEFAEKLRGEGRRVVRRWRFLVVGANNEDDARQLAEQIKREAPRDATVRAEHSGVFLPFIPF